MGVDEELSAMLVVDDEATGTIGWSLLVSFVDLLSADQNMNVNIKIINANNKHLIHNQKAITANKWMHNM